MRAWTMPLAGLLVLAMVAGCMGERPIEVEPGSTSPASSSSPGANEDPVATIRVLNASGVEGGRIFVGDNVTFTASGSVDPDGEIVDHSWKIVEGGVYAIRYGELLGEEVVVRFLDPGQRSVSLFVEDERGGVGYASEYLSVHQRVLGSGDLAAGPLQVVGVTSHEYKMPMRAGALLLSIQANFTPMQLTKVHLEIRLPNGTAINVTESGRSPLWSIALAPAVYGNYTAVIHLAQGAPLAYRLEFVAWYGYGV